jgi:hypothetical protein
MHYEQVVRRESELEAFWKQSKTKLKSLFLVTLKGMRHEMD